MTITDELIKSVEKNEKYESVLREIYFNIKRSNIDLYYKYTIQQLIKSVIPNIQKEGE